VIGLEEEMRPVCIGDRLSVDNNLNMAFTRQRVHPFVRIARVLKNLLVFFHPLVHLGPFESTMIF
jgi:hypothetical protein